MGWQALALRLRLDSAGPHDADRDVQGIGAGLCKGKGHHAARLREGDVALGTAPAVSDAQALLAVNNIEVIYNHVVLVLKGVSLEVPERGIVALLGGNGAGKTTTLKAISNLLRAERGEVTKGSITFAGARIDVLDASTVVKRGLIQVMEGRHCFAHLTVEENLLTGAYTRPDGRARLVEEIFTIVERLNTAENVGFVVAEQNTNIALRYADYGYILENGRVVMDGAAAALRSNEDVKEFYLGLSATGRKSYRDVKHYRRRKRWLA